MNKTKYGTSISRGIKPRLDILKYCESINFRPDENTLKILSKYGDIIIGENHILGFDSPNRANNDETPLIIQITKYEQANGLPEGYLVIQRFTIGKHRPYEIIVVDEHGSLYQYQLKRGLIKTDSIKPLNTLLAGYLVELFTKWTYKHFV